jgi:hypothetical protein
VTGVGRLQAFRASKKPQSSAHLCPIRGAKSSHFQRQSALSLRAAADCLAAVNARSSSGRGDAV